jgi:hypothetical protein
MSLHKLLREGEGWPQTICGREGQIYIARNGRRFMKTYLSGKYELAAASQSPTCRHCLRYAKPEHLGRWEDERVVAK